MQFLIEAATGNYVELAKDSHGSYVLENCFSYCDGEQMNRFLDGLKGAYADLSMQKFDSHVVEKCIKYAVAECIEKLSMLLKHTDISLLGR